MGKGGQKDQSNPAQGAAPTATEVLIESRYYDVSKLKHPGGSVIKFYTGNDIDASQAFANFHIRSRKARKIMETLPSRAVDESVRNARLASSSELEKPLPGQTDLLRDFDLLTQQLEKEGFFKPAPLHVVFRIFEIVLMHALGIWILFRGASIGGETVSLPFLPEMTFSVPLLYLVPALFLLGVASGRCGWLMHEGGHYSLTGNIQTDRTLQIILYGVGCGMSGSWWRNQHNKHHSMPQKLGHDVDLNTLPLVAFTERVVKKIGFPMKLWLRMQPFLFPVVTCELVALGWQFFLHPRHILRTKNAAEAASLVARYSLWTYFITMHPSFGIAGSAAFYLAYNWIASTYIFMNFAVSHTHLPVVAKEDRRTDWVRYAAIHTMNVAPGPLKWVDWWMSFLNYQIEHHLFPSMPQFRHPIVSPRVRALLEKHGLKYDQRSYAEAMYVTFQNLDKVGMDVFYG